MGETIIRLAALPHGLNGYVSMDAEGDYNVYINSRLTCEQQRRTLEHELEHIERDDFWNDAPIELIENLA